MNTPFSIIIADDHSMFLDGLTSILAEEKSINIILTAKTGTQVLKYLRINTDEKIDLVITDINMPEMDGVELNAAIKAEFPKIKTLVVSMLEDAKKIKILTEANANGYISKNAEKAELLKAISFKTSVSRLLKDISGSDFAENIASIKICLIRGEK